MVVCRMAMVAGEMMRAQTVDEINEATAALLGDGLIALGEKVVTAESCTGGLLAGAMTAVPGSSGWFEQGWVTYSNEAKQQALGVAAVALKDFGAVSEMVARQMVTGALAMAPGAALALSTTGIAGPGGGTPDKPVGLVWFGFARRTAQGVVVSASHQLFKGDRHAVRQASVRYSLEQALQWVRGAQ